MFTVTKSNAEVTPFLSANNDTNKQHNNNSKQSSDSSKQNGKQTTAKENNSKENKLTSSAANEDEDFQEPKIATKKNKRVGSKVVSKSTKRVVTMKKVVRAAKSGVLPKNRAVAAGKAHPKKKGG